MAEKVGVFNRLWISAGASDASYREFEFLDGTSLGLQEGLVGGNGMNGSRTPHSERVRRGVRQTGGQLVFQPSPVEIDHLLQWALGGTKSGSSIPLAETVPARWVKLYRDGEYRMYDGVKVDNLNLQCSEGGLLTLSLGVTGIDEVTSVAPTTPTAMDTTGGPYGIFDCVASIAATSYAFRSFQMTLNNALEVRHNNSLTPSSIHATGRQISVGLSLPYGDASAVYGSSEAGVAVVATFTNGTVSLALTFPKVATPRTPIPFGARNAISMDWTGIARGASAVAGSEMACANDSTP